MNGGIVVNFDRFDEQEFFIAWIETTSDMLQIEYVSRSIGH